MKKRGIDLKQLLLTGFLGGLLHHSSSVIADETAGLSLLDKMKKAEGGNFGYHLVDEEDLMLELNEKSAELYKGLSPEGKRLARVVASQRCDGSNECKGLNACKTDDHECAGMGQCKGTSKCGISDKNLAVKLVAKRMAEEEGQKKAEERAAILQKPESSDGNQEKAQGKSLPKQ